MKKEILAIALVIIGLFFISFLIGGIRYDSDADLLSIRIPPILVSEQLSLQLSPIDDAWCSEYDPESPGYSQEEHLNCCETRRNECLNACGDYDLACRGACEIKAIECDPSYDPSPGGDPIIPVDPDAPVFVPITPSVIPWFVPSECTVSKRYPDSLPDDLPSPEWWIRCGWTFPF